MLFVDSLMVKIALIGVLGVGAQWIAWRTGRPAIALMLLTGLIAGPVLGIIDPERDFGALQEPIIKLAVAVILFDGGLSLNFRELRHHAGPAVLRLVILGVPIGWALGTAAAYYGAGLSLPVSALFGGILVVTGPTVIGPMLRTLRIGQRPANILKWEGIVNDPIGALLAVFIFAYITYQGEQVSVGAIALDVALSSLLAGLIGFGLGYAITWLFPRGFVPEFLKAPVLLVFVIGGFIVADLIQHETGLVTVTVMGITLANRPIYSFQALRRFKEDLGVLLVSGVFIILPATLDWETLRAFEARFLVFLILLLFVVRPVTVLVSLFLSKVPWRERLFIAWIAPRGVVAVAITGLFALRLTEFGVADADALIPLSFGVVVATIFAHGFTAQKLAEHLGIDQGPGRGVLLIGANSWTIAFGRILKQLEIPVTVADTSKLALRTARRAELDVYRGDILDEVTQDHIDMKQFQQLVAATDNDAYNALVCADLGPELGFEAVSQIGADQERGPVRGRVLMPGGPSIEELVTRQAAGWQFSRTRLSEEFGLKDHLAARPEGAESLAVLKPSGRLLFFSTDARPVTEAGDTVISYVPPEKAAQRREKKAAQAAARPAATS
ncbi:cation:proton antiporter [Sphingosinicella humi]|uniref:cation:proton antiporter n=1 Tax=Allosphingosinicella humi TaxID=2068657 RepID=UPI0014781CBC|nr:sodium:proton antiporter [Sphingosinicella humi]